MGKWEMVRLGDVCDVLNGFAFQSTNYIANGHRVIRITNVQKGVIVDDDPKYYTQSPTLDKYELYDNDLLMSLTGNVGRVGLIYKNMLPAYLNQRVACLRGKTPILSKRFLYSYLNTDNFERAAINSSKGLAQKNMSTEWLKDYTIPLPPLPVQQQIADVLDRASALIEKRKAQIDRLDLLVKSQFALMFGDAYNIYELKAFPNICDFIDYRGRTPEKSNAGISLITAKNVKENQFSIEPKEYIPAKNYESIMTRGFPATNDVLFTTEAPLGNVCRIPPIFNKFCVGQRIITMHPHNDKLTSEYLERALLTKQFQDNMWKKSSGSTVKGIRSKELALLQIPVPPMPLQTQFADFVQSVEAQKSQLQKSLAKLEQNYKSLMQKCFRGQIF